MYHAFHFDVCSSYLHVYLFVSIAATMWCLADGARAKFKEREAPADIQQRIYASDRETLFVYHRK